jgi:hypothetical protein
MDIKSYFRVQVYVPVVENMTAELERRFSSTRCNIRAGLDALNPLNKNFASFECLRQLATHYQSNTVDLEHELHSIRRLVEKKSEKT